MAWEIDVVIGAGNQHCIVTLVERKTGASLIGKLRCRKVVALNPRSGRSRCASRRQRCDACEAMAAAKRGDAAAAKAAADRLVALSNEPDQHPFARQIIKLQATEAEAVAAQTAGDTERAIAMMDEAIAIEDSIYALSQPPYPPIPAHELYGTMLMEIKRPADAMKQFVETLKRTPGRAKAIDGIAHAAQALADKQLAMKNYAEFLELWKHADRDRPEIANARVFIETIRTGSR